ncbi:uncharacterized protein PITG_13649 [Phytophthora infestans T30-4]|uniref:DDE-1 domain-containing protein n=1 Tax=Phytophthora infestans (strain T30-4) TaxID=403677 RepID=D0NMG8_PHYIT|nr:uncharacterized protein PITG_13649 [Phytophthora infestans T30-4]EEY60889.1 conserved hypothetical protein [Phytophthora infestans T30-4]|eukprot:XP_002899835.1 conserved hypothetical protein [Phytophthora infestans T30-4]
MPSQRVPKSIAKKKEVLVEIDCYADGVPSRAFSHFVVKMGWKISAAQIRYWYKTALVWDSMSAHISKAIKARCAAKKIEMVVVPGGCTPYLQAGDIGIYKSFKDHMAPF